MRNGAAARNQDYALSDFLELLSLSTHELSQHREFFEAHLAETPLAFGIRAPLLFIGFGGSTRSERQHKEVLSKIPFNENGIAYESEPFDEPLELAGRITGTLNAIINKRDLDMTLAFYEVLPEGGYFNLGYYLGRASYAADSGKRQLLEPGRVETIPFTQTPFMVRQMQKGSRLLVLLNVNKNTYAQVNHGTGADVSDESLQKDTPALRVEWQDDSFIEVPIAR